MDPHAKFHRRLLVLIPTLGDGFALVDLYQLRGGTEHWRTLLGPQGEVAFQGAPLESRPGTAAGPDINRNQRDGVPLSRQALTLIDQIREGQPGSRWTATYTCRDRAEARLDIHAVGSPAGLRLQTGRGTHPLTAPDESPYRFSPLLLSRPADPNRPTAFNLVFEARLGPPTLAQVDELRAEHPAATSATGLRLTLADQTRVTLLWNPEAAPDAVTAFEDGLKLRGSWGFIREPPGGTPTVVLPAGGSLTAPGRPAIARPPLPSGRVMAIDDQTREITLRGETPGDWSRTAWIQIGPRRHWYQIESVRPGAQSGEYRIGLAVSRVLSIARLHDIGPTEIGLHAQLPLAWGDFFRDCHLESEPGIPALAVENIKMREDRPVAYAVLKPTPDRTALAALKTGHWVKLVDFQIGDTATGVAEPAET